MGEVDEALPAEKEEGEVKHRNDWYALTEEEIYEEVRIRRKLIDEMVGWLYPSIVAQEIIDLHALVPHAREKRKQLDELFRLSKKIKDDERRYFDQREAWHSRECAYAMVYEAATCACEREPGDEVDRDTAYWAVVERQNDA